MNNQVLNIKINENESYSINFNDEMSTTEFKGFLMRLTGIGKLCERQITSLDMPTSTTSSITPRIKDGTNLSWSNNREEILKMATTMKYGTDAEKLTILDSFDFAWDNKSNFMRRLQARKTYMGIFAKDVIEYHNQKGVQNETETNTETYQGQETQTEI